ncbi:MAG: hypothetical protein HOP23_01490 [Methylococcaceae bacterium]|nr:hypothetical protein [Methylococcaceae bacterium]
MKKIPLLIQLVAVAILYSSASQADGGEHHHGHHGHGWGHHHRHHGRGPGYGYYPPAQVNYYYPLPQVNNYYAPPPPVAYYPPQRYGYDQRSHQGLAGGVIGSVFGYELGGGDPLATGIGAAAGSFLGNGVGSRY